MAPPVTRKTVSTPSVQRPSERKPAAVPQAPAAAAPSTAWGPKAPVRRAAVDPFPAAKTLSDLATRKGLATKAVQKNAISEAAGNANRVCGGAAVVSALLMRSSTPGAAQANARALQDSFDSTGAAKFLPASVNKEELKQAFERFGTGTPTSNDVSLMQQAAYALGRKYGPPEKDDGLSVGQMGGMVADLKARGANLGPETKFIQVKNHWVAQTPEAVLNSDQTVSLQPKELNTKDTRWAGDVTVRADGKVELRTRQLSSTQTPAWEGGGWKMELNPARSNDIADLFKKGDHFKQLNEQLQKAKQSEAIDLN